MSFTRFHDDTPRIEHSVQASRDVGNYYLYTPGQGTDLPFMEDPQMRIQQWGANLMSDTTNLESDLRGISRKLTRDPNATYQSTAISQPTPMSFPVSNQHVLESRASHPAWMYKSQDHTRWEVPLLNPIANLEKGFHDNIQTRILEKDYFREKTPVSMDVEHGYVFQPPNYSDRFAYLDE